jgi:hypothetical protein
VSASPTLKSCAITLRCVNEGWKWSSSMRVYDIYKACVQSVLYFYDLVLSVRRAELFQRDVTLKKRFGLRIEHHSVTKSARTAPEY